MNVSAVQNYAVRWTAGGRFGWRVGNISLDACDGFLLADGAASMLDASETCVAAFVRDRARRHTGGIDSISGGMDMVWEGEGVCRVRALTIG